MYSEHVRDKRRPCPLFVPLRWELAQSVSAVYVAFGLYTTAAVFLLLLGLASALAEAPGQVLLDNLLSTLNPGLGVFLVRRRPLDG